ncbi:DUF86 domain-containing protein [soil metagenome]
MKRSAAPHIELIRGALRQIYEYLPANREDFLAQSMAQDAILMRLQVIGENLARIHKIDEYAFRDRAPDTWHEVIGLRNIIAHGYEIIEAEEIWQIIADGELLEFASTIKRVDVESG